MQIERLLQQQGFGTRKDCRALIQAGRFSLAGKVCENPFQEIDNPPDGLMFSVDGKEWPYHEKAVILLNKPVGYECSRRARHHPGVHALLPPQFSVRSLECAGRLDVETTGLILLTDDGQLAHCLLSPRKKIPKRYRAQLAEPLDEKARQRLLAGVMLKNDPAPAVAEAVEFVENDTSIICLTLTEGRYHQVRRMIAAVGNHVETLCRLAVGALELPADLPEGCWRWATDADLKLIA